MVISIKTEDTVIKVNIEEDATWTDAVEKFVDMLYGCGYIPYDFVYEKGVVTKLIKDHD